MFWDVYSLDQSGRVESKVVEFEYVEFGWLYTIGKEIYFCWQRLKIIWEVTMLIWNLRKTELPWIAEYYE